MPPPSKASTQVMAAVPPAVLSPEPVITIISSDGETFSISANAVAHSTLLDGAVRKWAEVYKAPSSTNAVGGGGGGIGGDSSGLDAGRSGSLPNDDETTTDVTVDDPEETPDERFIQNYYDETASDLTTTSGVIDDMISTLNGRAMQAGEAEADRPNVKRMVSVPANGDEDENGDTTPPYASMPNDEDEKDGDSDRTASVLPSSHEGSLSSSTTPTKMSFGSDKMNDNNSNSNNNGEAVAASAAPRSISPFLNEVLLPSPPSSSSSTASRPMVAGSGASHALSHSTNAPVRSIPSSAAAEAAATTSTTTTTHLGGAAPAKLTTLTKSGLAMRSPANAVTSPTSRSSHPSPSTLMDADQSTPSVLSEEEEEEMEVGSGDGVGLPQPHVKADPRNLGDEGLNEDEDGEAATAAAAQGSDTTLSPSPSPEATAVAAAPTASSSSTSSGINASTRHVDSLDPAFAAAAAAGGPAAASSSNTGKPSSPPSRSGLNERRHNTTIVQAGVAEEDTDVLVTSAVEESSPDAVAPHDITAGAANTSPSNNTPDGARIRNGHLSTSPAPDWRSPSSCHQRTPCITDEDDVGAMVGDAEESSEGKTAVATEPPVAEASTLTTQEGHAAGLNGVVMQHTVPTGSNVEGIGAASKSGAAAVGPLASSNSSICAGGAAAAVGAVAAADPDSAVMYKDGIRITSSAIVFDLLNSGSPRTSSSTPMVSPQSLHGGGDVLPEMTAAEAPDLLSPLSASSHVAGGDEVHKDGRAAAGDETTTVPAVALPAESKMSIHSSTLMLCIKYMSHFAEAEAQAAAAAAAAAVEPHKHHHKHHHHDHQGGSSSNATSTTTSSSDSSGDNGSDSESSTGSAGSISPPIPAGVPPTGSFIVGGSTAGASTTTGNAGEIPTSVNAGAPPGGPAMIPMPLTAPLVTRLSPWERTFLYIDVLGAPETTLTAALAVQDVCPDFDYCCPGPHLSSPRVKAALMTPPPPPEGVHALMELLAAARQLQIEPLHALCAGWLADFMIRVSYGATDNFEAAHLIRQCLRVPSDWSRRETDCLKLENEWPANEDAE